jgi:hypothetical protein
MAALEVAPEPISDPSGEAQIVDRIQATTARFEGLLGVPGLVPVLPRGVKITGDFRTGVVGSMNLLDNIYEHKAEPVQALPVVVISSQSEALGISESGVMVDFEDLEEPVFKRGIVVRLLNQTQEWELGIPESGVGLAPGVDPNLLRFEEEGLIWGVGKKVEYVLNLGYAGDEQAVDSIELPPGWQEAFGEDRRLRVLAPEETAVVEIPKAIEEDWDSDRARRLWTEDSERCFRMMTARIEERTSEGPVLKHRLPSDKLKPGVEPALRGKVRQDEDIYHLQVEDMESDSFELRIIRVVPSYEEGLPFRIVDEIKPRKPRSDLVFRVKLETDPASLAVVVYQQTVSHHIESERPLWLGLGEVLASPDTVVRILDHLEEPPQVEKFQVPDYWRWEERRESPPRLTEWELRY